MLSVYKRQVMIEHYKKITLVSDTCIDVCMEDYHIQIEGNNLHVLALESSEILLEGDLKGIIFHE